MSIAHKPKNTETVTRQIRTLMNDLSAQGMSFNDGVAGLADFLARLNNQDARDAIALLERTWRDIDTNNRLQRLIDYEAKEKEEDL